LLLCVIKIMMPKKIIKTLPLIPFLSFGFIISMFLL
jgi:prepilin signal peptidase PulO-like enzyme (type II secretory pathway)